MQKKFFLLLILFISFLFLLGCTETDIIDDTTLDIPQNINIENNLIQEDPLNETNILRISNCEELQAIPNNSESNYILTKDINCYETRNWNNRKGFRPIKNFSGVLDGQDYKISELYINRSENIVGLFETLDGGEISNIILIDTIVKGTEKGFGFVNTRTGIVAGVNKKGLIFNVHVSGEVFGSKHVGGLTGINTGIISHSSSDVNVVGNHFAIGGLSGSLSGTIYNSYSLGDVNGDNRVGGLVGKITRGKIYDSYARGNINIIEDANKSAGGLVGQNVGGQIIRTYSTGKINCLNSTKNCGGLVGYSDKDTLEETDIYGEGPTKILSMGVIAREDISFWDIESSGFENSLEGIGKNTVEMKKPDTFQGWDFDNIWEHNEEDYPTLKKFDKTIQKDSTIKINKINFTKETEEGKFDYIAYPNHNLGFYSNGLLYKVEKGIIDFISNKNFELTLKSTIYDEQKNTVLQKGNRKNDSFTEVKLNINKGRNIFYGTRSGGLLTPKTTTSLGQVEKRGIYYLDLIGYDENEEIVLEQKNNKIRMGFNHKYLDKPAPNANIKIIDFNPQANSVWGLLYNFKLDIENTGNTAIIGYFKVDFYVDEKLEETLYFSKETKGALGNNISLEEEDFIDKTIIFYLFPQMGENKKQTIEIEKSSHLSPSILKNVKSGQKLVIEISLYDLETKEIITTAKSNNTIIN